MIQLLRSIVVSGLMISPLILFPQGYFQQKVDQVITVSLDDVTHVLHAQQEFTYTNNSPIALDTIWMHLWPNAYSEPNTALDKQLMRMGNVKLHFASEKDRGRIDSLDFRSAGEALTWALHEEHPDIAWIKLNSSLASGSSITITTPFRVKIPHSRYSRLGHTGQAYHITQWYPKPAVFDKDGWHAMPYLTQGEFYSEFGSFDVSITLPKNYVVGATGILQTEEEKAFLSDRATREANNSDNPFPPSDPATKTIRFIQDSIHDFGWFADKRFIVRKGSVTLLRSGRTIDTYTMFTPKNAALWENSIEYVNESVRLYSEWVGDYPYDACTAIDGTISAGGGMEYPMITIIGNMGSKESLDNVIAHEVGHNWFYGILASNEREHPWMDEGMNSFVELRYMRERYPDGGITIDAPLLRNLTKGIKDGHRFQSEAMYRINARRNLDQPICKHSTDFTMLNYGGIVYSKTAMVFDHLFAYLGAEIFDRCMRAYFDEWKFRHPSPADVKAVFERESGRDLGWVFNGLICSEEKIDLKAEKLNGDQLKYANKTSFAIPFPISAWKDTALLGTTWIDGVAGKGSAKLPWADADVACIDHDQRTLDIDRRNNQIGASGIFRRWNLPHFGFLSGIEKHDRSSIYWTPLIARNGHDGWHLGLGLHNYHFPSQRTEWIVAPMYAFNSERIIGGARIEHHFDRMRSRIFQNIGIALNARSASTFDTDSISQRYFKLSPSLILDIARDPLSRPWNHQIQLRSVYIGYDSQFSNREGRKWDYYDEHFYLDLIYSAINNAALLPATIKSNFTVSETFFRTSLEIGYGSTYNKRKDQLRLRAFVGSFLWKDDNFFLDQLETWQLSWGPQDMLFDHVYLERGRYDTDAFGRQFNKQQGAFKTPFFAGSDSWIGAVNAELDLPIPFPISIFGSWGLTPSRTSVTVPGQPTEIRNTTSSFMEGGLGIQLIRDQMEVWFPLVVSERIADQEKFAGRDVADRIRFVLTFEKFDPTRALRKVRP